MRHLESHSLMAHEAEQNDDHRHNRSCNIWCLCGSLQIVSQNRDQKRHTCQSDEYTAAVDSKTANPFNQVIPTSTKDEPLVSKKGDADRNQASKKAREHVVVSAQPRSGPVQESEKAITKNSIESSNKNVAHKLLERPWRIQLHVESIPSWRNVFAFQDRRRIPDGAALKHSQA